MGKYDAIWRVGLDAPVTVLDFLKRIGTWASLREFEDGAQMDKETIRGCMTQFLPEIKALYEVTYLNQRPPWAEMGSICSVCADVGFLRCIGRVDGTKLVWKNRPYSLKGQ